MAIRLPAFLLLLTFCQFKVARQLESIALQNVVLIILCLL